jgi:hypothetical protein
MNGMTVSELMERLEDLPSDAVIKVAHQPHYPLAFDLVTVVFAEHPDEDELMQIAVENEWIDEGRERLLGGEPGDDEVIENAMAVWYEDRPAFENTVWLGTSEGNADAPHGPYAPSDAWNEDLNG